MSEKSETPREKLLRQEREYRNEERRSRQNWEMSIRRAAGLEPKRSRKTDRPLRPVFSQAELSNLRYPLEGLLKEVKAELFPTVEERVAICFAKMDYLACIGETTNGRIIQIHPLLNHLTTPREFMRELLIHELGHITVPPRIIEGKRDFHPPEYWEEQRRLLGGPGFGDLWFSIASGGATWDDAENQCCRVKPRLWKKVWKNGFPDWEIMKKVFDQNRG